MAGTDADARVAALKAIVQTLILEHYSEENEEETKRRFLAMAEADLPVAMAIVNELTEAELDAAFRWPRGSEGDARSELPATPVVAFLTEEQQERVRVTSVAEDEGDRARAIAMEERDVSGGKSLPACERVRIAEERFVSAMVEDLVRHRGKSAAVVAGTIDERVAGLPESWMSRTRRELERLRDDLDDMLASSGESEVSGASDPDGPAPGTAR